MVSSTLLLVGFASIFLYVTPCIRGEYFEQTPVGTRIPFEVVLGDYENLVLFCGGSLITNFYVLTAAECVINRQPNEIEVFIGIRSLSLRYAPGSTVRLVYEIIVHDLYDPRNLWRNDIALLRLGPLKFSHRMVSELLAWGIVPQKNELNKISKQNKLLVKLSGHGIVYNVPVNNKIVPSFDELMESFTYTVDWKLCREVYEKIHYNISDTHICAYDNYAFLHLEHRISDVGSPMIINQNLILGIALNVSRGFHSAAYPLLFTNVSCYRDWIQSILDRYDKDFLTRTISKN